MESWRAHACLDLEARKGGWPGRECARKAVVAEWAGWVEGGALTRPATDGSGHQSTRSFATSRPSNTSSGELSPTTLSLSLRLTTTPSALSLGSCLLISVSEGADTSHRLPLISSRNSTLPLSPTTATCRPHITPFHTLLPNSPWLIHLSPRTHPSQRQPRAKMTPPLPFCDPRSVSYSGNAAFGQSQCSTDVPSLSTLSSSPQPPTVSL